MVSGVVSITATAADNVAVVSVQFNIDGAPQAAAITSAPYSATWTTTDFDDGNHTITATANDAAGNSGASAAVTVVVDNTEDPDPDPAQLFLAETLPVSQVYFVQTSGAITLKPVLEFSAGLHGDYDCYAAYLKDGDIYLAEEDITDDVYFHRFRDGDTLKSFGEITFSGETTWAPDVFNSKIHPNLDIILKRGVVFFIGVMPAGGGEVEGAIFTFGE